MKLTNKYDTYKQKKGIYIFTDSVTDKSQAEDSNIYSCIEKYGITSLIQQSMAKEPLYLDNTNRNMTVADAVRMKQEMNEYFEQLPAKVRKVFGDNPDIFYEKYKAGEFNEMLTTGVLTQEQINELKEENNETRLEENNNGNNNNNTDSNKGDTGNVENN